MNRVMVRVVEGGGWWGVGASAVGRTPRDAASRRRCRPPAATRNLLTSHTVPTFSDRPRKMAMVSPTDGSRTITWEGWGSMGGLKTPTPRPPPPPPGPGPHLLEAALERRIFLDVGAVLGQRGGPDAVQLAAREHRLEHVARVHRPLRFASADHGVNLVDEEDNSARRLLDLLGEGNGGRWWACGRAGRRHARARPSSPHHPLLPPPISYLQDRGEALLELASVLGPGDEASHVKRDELDAAKRVGHISTHNPLGQPLRNCSLADAGLADENGVVFCPAAEHPHDAADFFVPPDHRVERRRAVGQRLAVPEKGLELLVPRFRVDAPRAAQGGHRRRELRARDARLLQARRHVLGFQRREQQVVDPQVRVARGLGRRAGRGQALPEILGKVQLVRRGRDDGQTHELLLEHARDRARGLRVADARERLLRDALGVVHQGRRQVRRREQGVAGLAGEVLERGGRGGGVGRGEKTTAEKRGWVRSGSRRSPPAGAPKTPIITRPTRPPNPTARP